MSGRHECRGRQLAFVLDIDGCLSRDGAPIPGAAAGLRRLRDAGVPFVFCTNGGGQLEEARARKLSETFGIDVDPDKQVVLSHTPLRAAVVPRFVDRRVLVVGEGCAPVARAYGLSRAEGVREYGQRHPSLFPRRREDDGADADDSDDPVAAVLWFNDPEDLGEAIQIVLDVLLTNGNPSGPRVLVDDPEAAQEVEIWFTNRDLAYSASAVHPRITQGSHRLCLEALFRSATSMSGRRGRDLIASTVGKPSRLTGETASSKLLAQCREGTTEDDLEIWTVGDNPLSDVALARTIGWKSALVKTGIWDGLTEPEVEPTVRKDSFAALLDDFFPLLPSPAR